MIMKNVASLFSDEMKQALHTQLAISLDNSHDYSADELEDLYERITDEFPLNYDGKSGRPLGLTAVMEDMIDVFYKNKLIAFN